MLVGNAVQQYTDLKTLFNDTIFEACWIVLINLSDFRENLPFN